MQILTAFFILDKSVTENNMYNKPKKKAQNTQNYNSTVFFFIHLQAQGRNYYYVFYWNACPRENDVSSSFRFWTDMIYDISLCWNILKLIIKLKYYRQNLPKMNLAIPFMPLLFEYLHMFVRTFLIPGFQIFGLQRPAD